MERCDGFCEKHKNTTSEISKYLDFIEEIENREDIEEETKKTIVGIPEGSLRSLIDEQDKEIREEAISHVEKSASDTVTFTENTAKKIDRSDKVQ